MTSERNASSAGQNDRAMEPVERNGWRIYVWSEFRSTWTTLRQEVEELARKSPDTYRQHPKTIFLRDVRDLILSQVPADPGADRYQHGSKLGAKYRHWRRAKFRGRFRLFFRYSSAHKTIIYVWLNDKDSLRKEGSRSDPYFVFRSMLERHRPPTDWNALLAECIALPAAEAG
ncbi:MAG TPA: type II toxin-antitoxin system YhaV family toxin [Longimicrobium sp.]|uniref:type II toxin-antitoxin system YhaV family toxin n=1 Tax=Longimicrobium sp. TaxID=2029185 RepID=UPI002ED8A8FB